MGVAQVRSTISRAVGGVTRPAGGRGDVRSEECRKAPRPAPEAPRGSAVLAVTSPFAFGPPDRARMNRAEMPTATQH